MQPWSHISALSPSTDIHFKIRTKLFLTCILNLQMYIYLPPWPPRHDPPPGGIQWTRHHIRIVLWEYIWRLNFSIVTTIPLPRQLWRRRQLPTWRRSGQRRETSFCSFSSHVRSQEVICEHCRLLKCICYTRHCLSPLYTGGLFSKAGHVPCDRKWVRLLKYFEFLFFRIFWQIQQYFLI